MSNETIGVSVKTENIAESLVGRIGAGDRSAEESLVAHYRRGLFLILRKECGDSELAQDLTQDTLEKVIRNAREGKIRKPRALAGYIRHLGVYQLIDLRRKENRRKTTPSADIAEYVADDNTNLVDMVDSEQTGHLVRQLLDEMAVLRDRELLRRFYLIGQDKAVIAKEFDITPAHFDRVKSRALLRLRKLAIEHLKTRGAVPADLLSILLLVALAGGGATTPAFDTAVGIATYCQYEKITNVVRERPTSAHFNRCTLGVAYPMRIRAQEERTS